MSWRDRFTREALTRSFAALRIRDYRRWSIAQLLSAAGGAASQVAIAWLVVELGGDGLALGVVTASTMVPTLALGPFIGAIVDRFSRRSVLIVTAVAQMAIAGVLAGLAFSGALQIWMLAVLSLAHGLAFAADNPARQLLVLDLVGRDRVTSAVSMNEVIINGARVLGPAVAGLLLVFADAAWCFVVNALVFVPSIIVLIGLRLRPETDRATPLRTSADEPSIAADPAAPPAPPSPGAWRFVTRTPPVRATLVLAICAAAGYNIAVVVPLIVANVFDAEGGTYGLLAVAFGLGALPGAFFSATGPTTPRGGEVRVLALVMGIAVLLSAAAPVLPVLFVGLAVVGAVVMWFIARANALVMLSTPPPIRGRVMGIWAMCLPGSTVLTGLAVGALAEAADPRVAYAVVGAVTVVLAGLSWRALGDRPLSARAA
ncbi:MFS transporter [uncultured Microbacterium sp.]|uniref:MFS transporter n=1 Tax=uncultured Microbacterium sp. TaxID=191216 RepID=UPI0028DD01FB|nr:MFS transporter [uncultured Microbacterium sp.]